MTDIAKLKTIFDEIRKCEDSIKTCEENIRSCQENKTQFEKRIEEKYAQVKEAMGESNEVQIKWSDNIIVDFYYPSPRASVKVDNIDSVPDDFIKVTKTPKLKEIGEYLKGNPGCNWASIEYKPTNLSYKILKN